MGVVIILPIQDAQQEHWTPLTLPELMELSHKAYQAILDQYALLKYRLNLLIPCPKLKVKNQTDGYCVIPKREDPPKSWIDLEAVKIVKVKQK